MPDEMPPSTSTSAPAELSLRLTAETTAPAVARRAVERKLEPWIDRQVLDSLRLLISELVTNSVRHADIGRTGRIDLRVQLHPDCVRVEVDDPGPGFVVPGQLPCGSG